MSSPPPLISVVMPMYNGARYLERAIASVLAQSERDFELLLCDDASTDDSLAIARRFTDPRIRLLVHEQNRGLFPTLNALIRASRAELIHVWTQDDVMYPYCLEREVAFHAAHPGLAMSYSKPDIIDLHGAITRPADRDHDATPTVLRPEQASELMFYFGSISANISLAVLRRSALDQVGLFREDMKVSGDFEMWTRLTGRFPIGFIRDPLVQVRSHTGQLSRDPSSTLRFTRENREILRVLFERLPERARRRARSYARRFLHVKEAHTIARNLLAGDVASAREGLALLADVDHPASVFLWWLVSGNHRWLKVKPKLVTFR